VADKAQSGSSDFRVPAIRFLIISLAILAGGYWYYRGEADKIRLDQHRTLSAIANLKAEQINHWRQERLDDCTLITRNPFMTGAIAELSRGGMSAGLHAGLRQSLENLAAVAQYANIMILNPGGRVLFTLMDEHDPVDAATRRAAAAAAARRGPVFSDFFRCPKGVVHIDVASAVRDSQGLPQAVVVLRSNAQTYLYPLIQSWPTPSPSAETLIVQRDGEELLFLNELRHKAGTALSLREPLTLTNLPAVQAVLGRLGRFEGIDYRGAEVMAELLPIPESGWYLVAKVDADEILAEARYRAGVTAMVLAALILLAAAGTAYLYRQRQALQFRSLYESERRQRETQETFRITLFSIGDAVITTDTAGRVREMNPAAEALTGWRKEEARGLALGEVFRIVNEQTREKAEDPVQRVLRDGVVVGLSNHTLLIARDGTERPIADSAAPIRDGSGAVLGVVLVFQDQTEERRSQRSLLESEERLRLALAAANQGLYDLNVQTGECVVNPEYARMLGFDPAEFHVTNAAWRERLHPEDREEVYRTYEDYVAGRRDEYRVEFRHQTKNGGWKWILSLGKVVARSADGTPLRMLGTHTDITDRKQAEEALKLTETRLRTLVDVIQHPSETEQEFLDYALEAAMALTASRLGYIYHYHEDRKQFVLNTWSRGVMAECRVAAPQTCYELDKTGIWGEAVRQRQPILVNDFEAAHLLKKGYPEGHVRLKRFLTVPIFSAGRILGVVGVANKESDYGDTDTLQLTLLMESVWKVNERRRAVEDLAKNEERYRRIFETAHLGIWVLDAGHKTSFVNPRMAEILGYGLEEMAGMEGTACVHADELGEHLNQIKSRARGEPGTYERRFRRKDGSVCVLLVSATPLLDAEGRYNGSFGMYTDITDRKQAEEERQKLEAQLLQVQKMEAIGRLAGGVAHDFNNMLGVILGFSEMALARMPAEDPARDCLEEVRLAAQRSAELTRQLLAFARRQTIAPQVLDLNETIEGMLKMLRRLIGEEIDLLWKPGEDLGAVRMDPSQIDQILANLMVNARDAIGGVGKIAIETGNQDIDADYCETHAGFAPGRFVQLAVSDNGRGMDKETQASLFEPFFTTKKMGQGTGLGLATVYGIVKQNNGFINIYSEPGQGSTFKIYLPRQQAEPAAAGIRPSPVETPTGTETVLLAEDEKPLLKFTRALLEGLGYKVLAAGGPREALRLAEESAEEIHLLLTDVVMPDMSGRELLELLSTLRPGIRSVFMSGYTTNVIAHHGVLDAGVHFIQKPFSRDSLARIIREALT
jgi:PAS domain S-box-containing protein